MLRWYTPFPRDIFFSVYNQYTAITKAAKKILLVGNKEELDTMSIRDKEDNIAVGEEDEINKAMVEEEHETDKLMINVKVKEDNELDEGIQNITRNKEDNNQNMALEEADKEISKENCNNVADKNNMGEVDNDKMETREDKVVLRDLGGDTAFFVNMLPMGMVYYR